MGRDPNRWYARGILFAMVLLLPSIARGEPEPRVLAGFTAFPYDLSLEAIDKVHEIILPNSQLYAIHFDRCLPWSEALENKPFPEWLQRDWQDIKTRIPATHTVYVAVTP
jgi:hypothetical protein